VSNAEIVAALYIRGDRQDKCGPPASQADPLRSSHTVGSNRELRGQGDVDRVRVGAISCSKEESPAYVVKRRIKHRDGREIPPQAHCPVTSVGATVALIPTLMAALARHAEERHAPPDGRLLRYADGRPVTYRRYDGLWVRIGRHLPWARTQQISTHWLRHTTLTWVERNFGYAIAHAYAGHTDGAGDTGSATSTYVRATLAGVVAPGSCRLMNNRLCRSLARR
jgi:hypothetical protein